MPGQQHISGGIVRGVADLVEEGKMSALMGIRSLVRIGEAAKRRGSTLPLLRRLSVRPDAGAYEAIPMGRNGSPMPRGGV